jgi:hypothetical protein
MGQGTQPLEEGCRDIWLEGQLLREEEQLLQLNPQGTGKGGVHLLV